MDAADFDRLTRTLGSVTARRTVMLASMGGLLAVLPLAPHDTAGKRKKRKHKKKNKKCTPPCPECQTCKNGNCVETDGAACGNSLCTVCQGGACGNRPNNSSCNTTGKCENGTCKPAPDCDRKGAVCADGTTCCSGDCLTGGTCATSALGEDCITNADCNASPIGGVFFCNLDFKCQDPVIGP